MNAPRSIDVLGLGCATVDELLYVSAYPAPDAKTQILRRQLPCGGLTATALVAAARLGARAAYASILGDDERSRFVLNRLADEGIDTSHTRRRPEASPVHSLIVVDETHHTRTIFFDASRFVLAAPDWPPLPLVAQARVLFVDHFGAEGMTQAARAARAQGVPVVADLERNDMPGFDALAAEVDHLILSRDFACRLTGQGDPAAAVRSLWGPGRAVVIVTGGAEGCWCLSADPPAQVWHQPAYRVPTSDTTGCGDVFHGAYAAELAAGASLPQRVRVATAAAALKACQPGGQGGIPTRAQLEAFLREQNR